MRSKGNKEPDDNQETGHEEKKYTGVASPGAKASQRDGGPQPRGATGRNEQQPSAKSAQHENVDRNEREHSEDPGGKYELSETDLNSLEEEDELEGSTRGLSSYSETDEDEDEGLGDGNIGRSTRSRGLDEEG